MADAIRRALDDDSAFWELIDDCEEPLGRFVEWAGACEEGGVATSLRFENRSDMRRCREVLGLFEEPWWGVVVYSCFDSTIGTRVVADVFAEPIPPEAAERELDATDFPPSSVQYHRAQVGHRGAKCSLASACDKEQYLRPIFTNAGDGFEERFDQLMANRPSWWARTTCFDALARAGVLEIAGVSYRPRKAHLAGSTGPAAGFRDLFGVNVTDSNAAACEELLRRWTASWHEVVERLGLVWDQAPYDSADFENALCLFQERPHGNRPDPQPREVDDPTSLGRQPGC